jgi:hypothetical protein
VLLEDAGELDGQLPAVEIHHPGPRGPLEPVEGGAPKRRNRGSHRDTYTIYPGIATNSDGICRGSGPVRAWRTPGFPAIIRKVRDYTRRIMPTS